MLASWKIEVGVLFIDNLPLLHFLTIFTVEEIMVEFLDTKKDAHITCQFDQYGNGWGGYVSVIVLAIKVD